MPHPAVPAGFTQWTHAEHPSVGRPQHIRRAPRVEGPFSGRRATLPGLQPLTGSGRSGHASQPEARGRTRTSCRRPTNIAPGTDKRCLPLRDMAPFPGQLLIRQTAIVACRRSLDECTLALGTVYWRRCGTSIGPADTVLHLNCSQTFCPTILRHLTYLQHRRGHYDKINSAHLKETLQLQLDISNAAAIPNRLLRT